MIEIACEQDLLRCVRSELVPENPKTKSGLLGLIQYRINGKENKNLRHPDCIYEGWDKSKGGYYGKSLISECFRHIYQIDPFSNDLGSSDTIFNCWSFLNRLVTAQNNGYMRSPEALIKALKDGFLFLNFGSSEESDTLKNLLDRLADLHHSLANFMPAPLNYNGTEWHDGKGNFEYDNDMPDLYYQRSDKLKLGRNGFSNYRDWIDENKESFCLEFFDTFKSGLTNGWADWERDDYRDGLMNLSSKNSRSEYLAILQLAIDCLEQRAHQLWVSKLNSAPLFL